MLNVTHQGTPRDAASVHLRPSITRRDRQTTDHYIMLSARRGQRDNNQAINNYKYKLFLFLQNT